MGPFKMYVIVDGEEWSSQKKEQKVIKGGRGYTAKKIMSLAQNFSLLIFPGAHFRSSYLLRF